MERVTLAGLTALLLMATAAYAQSGGEREPARYRVEPTTAAIRVDAVLDEPAWSAAQPMELAWETSPRDNVPAPLRTVGYMTYDRDHLYVAFRAYDDDPAAIRARLADRDSSWSDDIIGVALDTFNDSRRAFEFFVNPLGVQMDMIMDDVNRNEDSSWDAIWESAGRITAEGFVVEMAIPFTSIRFPSTDGEQTWGIDMVRLRPRSTRIRMGLHPQDRDRDCYLCQASKVTGFRGITPGRDVELDPTLTAQSTRLRAPNPQSEFGSADNEVEAGLTARWGITPNLTLNAALNPDFSQIEADAVQLDINARFALFFPEKRPFFLEGSDFFDSPFQVVYTRTVADPEYGAKVTGRFGTSVVGAWVARDAFTNLVLPGPEGSSIATLEDENLSSAFRYRYDLGETSSVGALFTSREASGYSNRVYGIDGILRITSKDSLTGQIVGSRSEYPAAIVSSFGAPAGAIDDVAARLRYRHSSKNWYWGGSYVDVGDDFRADSGFMPQVGYRAANAGFEHIAWGEEGKNWYTRVIAGADYDRAEKQSGELLEEEVEAWGIVLGPMQSEMFLVAGDRSRRHRGVTFDERFLHWGGELNPTRDLFTYIEGTFADQVDFANVRLGDMVRLEGGFRWNFGIRTRLDASHAREHLEVEGGRLFSAGVTELKAFYHFNARTFVRAILQHTDISRNPALYLHQTVDARSERFYPQLLFSYKLNPQTVFFAGYSGTALGGTFEQEQIDLRETDRTFFLKLGYAWLF